MPLPVMVLQGMRASLLKGLILKGIDIDDAALAVENLTDAAVVAQYLRHNYINTDTLSQ